MDRVMKVPNPLIGMFDSGVGGLTVLAEAIRLLPAARFFYYADSGFAPYGEKSREVILARCFYIADEMTQRSASAICVACNTATSSAIAEMRRHYTIPIVGMEPALKPAVESCPDGKILVLGTAFTIHEPKYQALLRRFSEKREIISLPCPGLVNLIEAGEKNSPAMERCLQELLKGHPLHEISAVVLGCTHFVYLKKNLREFFGGEVQFFDGNSGTVRQLARVLIEKGIQFRDEATGAQECITLETSGDRAHVLPLCRDLLSELLNSSLTISV
jgi:glutamate racemase